MRFGEATGEDGRDDPLEEVDPEHLCHAGRGTALGEGGVITRSSICSRTSSGIDKSVTVIILQCESESMSYNMQRSR